MGKALFVQTLLGLLQALADVRSDSFAGRSHQLPLLPIGSPCPASLALIAFRIPVISSFAAMRIL
jgi:hypothetical protein